MTHVIEAIGLSKVYKLYANHTDRLKEAFDPRKRSYHRDFYALKDLDILVEKGETVGIIGRNGSGKSTMLKILTGVTAQTSGMASVTGRVAALLELGAGFNMEMTGMENIFLNGMINGLKRHEVEERLQSILSFADIGDFIDQPVKMYSSGMFVRLAFAMAIHIDPDILIVDEALSVGDIFFQQKCYRKFEEFKQRGKTILFVTHDLNSVLKYCDRALVLHEGRKVAEGSPKEMVDLYKKIAVNHFETTNGQRIEKDIEDGRAWKDALVINPNVLDYGDGGARIVDFGIFSEDGLPAQSILKGERCSVRMRVKIVKDIEFPIFAMTIKDIKGNELTGTNSKIEMIGPDVVHAGEEYLISFRQMMSIQGGNYFISLGCTRFDRDGEFVVEHRLYDVLSFHVVASKFVVGIFDMGIEMDVHRTR